MGPALPMPAAYLAASISGLQSVRQRVSVHTCAAEQTLSSAAQALAARSGAKGRRREGYGSHCDTKADLPDASFRLDPFWKL